MSVRDLGNPLGNPLGSSLGKTVKKETPQKVITHSEFQFVSGPFQGTIEVPNGAIYMRVAAIGAGGGGLNKKNKGYGGGGGGSASTKIVKAEPIKAEIGTGGFRIDGSDTVCEFASYRLVGGGGKGGTKRLGGTGSGGDRNYTGGYGGFGDYGGAGGGSAGVSGNGGNGQGGTTATAGKPGSTTSTWWGYGGGSGGPVAYQIVGGAGGPGCSDGSFIGVLVNDGFVIPTQPALLGTAPGQSIAVGTLKTGLSSDYGAGGAGNYFGGDRKGGNGVVYIEWFFGE